MLTELPEGFVETSTVDNDASFVAVYQNEKDDKIILSQSITEGYWIDIDNEYGNISGIDISGIKVTFYESDDCIVAVWIQDQYAFNLTVYGEYNICLLYTSFTEGQRGGFPAGGGQLLKRIRRKFPLTPGSR